MNKKLIVKKIVIYEVIGFSVIVLLLWLDEIIDIPHVLFHGEATPINWVECIWESALIFIFSIFIIHLSRRFLKEIKYLEGLLHVCSFCKKIRVDNRWIPIEEYMRKYSEVALSHSLCPECAKKHYGDFIDEK